MALPPLALAVSLGIVGGAASPSPAEDAAVCISAEGFPYCSGVLVGPRSVLTAGHCIDVLGAHVKYEVNVGPDCHAPLQRITAVRRTTHPQFSGEGKPFDLGYLSLATDAYPAPLPLAAASLDVGRLVGTAIRHVGYGGTDEGSQLSGNGIRRTVSHAILRVDGDFIWSGDSTSNTCLMDSGGPMLLDGAAGPVVIATVSDGPSCREAGADQRVDRGLDWITAQLAEDTPPAQDGGTDNASARTTGCSAVPGSWAWGAVAAVIAARKRHS